MFYNIVVNLAYVLFNIIYRFRLIGEDNIPTKGKLVVCSNHKNNLDPVLIAIMFPRKISWMAKRELFNNKILAYLIRKVNAFPVNRDEVDISAVKNALKVLKENKVLGIFPEGTRVKELDLTKAKAGASMLAIRAKSPVLPVYIDSSYKLFSKVNIYIGKPLYLHNEVKGKPSPEEYKEFSKEILATIYNLKEREE